MTVRWPLSYCTLDRSPLFGQPETLREQATAAAAAGFTHYTPDMFALRAYLDAGHRLGELAAHLQSLGLTACDIAGSNVSADREASLAEAKELAGYGRELGASWVQARITAPLDDPATLDTYRRCAEVVAADGCGFALEFSPFTPINSLGRAREVLAEVRDASPRQGIVVDTWHLAYLDGVDALRALPAEDLAFVQLDDAEPNAGVKTSDTMHRRALPGEGVLGLSNYVAALRDIGFDGVITVEVLSASLRELDLDEYVRRTYESSVALLAGA
jgi:sugar phosphate isomerase/epimerase